jgi:chemotaxis protein CheD
MFEPESEVAEVYVNPGEMFLARQPTVIRTLLGSCVGVTFWNERLKIGALCHGMLPKCPSDSSNGLPPASRYRFVDFAIRDIARQFDELGAQRSEVEVKVFGGGDVLLGENGIQSDCVEPARNDRPEYSFQYGKRRSSASPARGLFDSCFVPA